MTKQMNEYVLLLNNETESTPLSTAFSTKLAQWVQDNGAADDMIRAEPSVTGPKLTMICTEALAHRIANSFASAVASIQMDKQNVITIPDPLPKKARRMDPLPG